MQHYYYYAAAAQRTSRYILPVLEQSKLSCMVSNFHTKRPDLQITVVSDEEKLIVTSQKSSLIVWKLNKIEKSNVTMHSSNFTPIDDIEGLKSKLGL